jgi:hypothetical protein
MAKCTKCVVVVISLGTPSGAKLGKAMVIHTVMQFSQVGVSAGLIAVDACALLAV